MGGGITSALDISENLERIRERLSLAATEAGRDAEQINLMAVSKGFGAESIRRAFAVGQRAFGESYVQESVSKIEQLADIRKEMTWHFIGPLQSNKTRLVANHFDWVHSLDRVEIAERLCRQRPAELPPLQICIQVNISREASKQGVAPEQILDFAKAVTLFPMLKLRGLMAIPSPSQDVAVQRKSFAALRTLFLGLQEHGMAVDTLSMGMSNDFEAAIAEGATWVRVGSAIFGQRVS